MRKLSEYKDDEAIEVLADILEPVCMICADKEVQDSMSGPKLVIARTCMKNHPKEVRQIMAILDGVPFEDYHIGVFDLPIKMLEILNDEDLINFFRSQGQMGSSNTFGSATENTLEEEPHAGSSAI